MTPQPNQLWNLSGTLFELLEAREEAAQNITTTIGQLRYIPGMTEEAIPDHAEVVAARAELAAIETGIQQFVAQQLRDVDGLRAPLKALEQGVAINRADAAAATNRAMVLQNRYDRLKDLIKQCMVALDQAGEWKPKESRKFESARGSFTLRGNGGAAPVEITDESLVPDEYCRVTVTMPLNQWKEILKRAGIEGIVVENGAKIVRYVSKSTIAAALEKPCAVCNDNDIANSLEPCSVCGGSGKHGVPGCRLAPRGESVIVK